MDRDREQFADLLGQMLETERVGMRVFEMALRCVGDGELRREWEGCLDETREHVDIVSGLIEHFDLDPDAESPGLQVVRHIGEALMALMEMSLREHSAETTRRIARECIMHVETKDHLNWEILSEALRELGTEGAASDGRREMRRARAACRPRLHRPRRRRLPARVGFTAASRPSYFAVGEDADKKTRGLDG